MKIKSIIIVLVLFMGNVSFSQDCPNYKENREKIESEKVAFLTEKLDLSVKEAQVFWPTYNEYQKKREDILISKRKLARKVNKI